MGDEMLPDYVMGKFDVKWSDVDFVYTTTNIDQHWMLIAFNLNRDQLFVFDSLPSMTSKKKLESFLEPLTYTLPSLLHYCDLKRWKPDIKTSRWKISQPTSTNTQYGLLDCGIFVVKLLEHLVTGNALSEITQDKITDYRMKLACQLWTNTPYY
ncbi:uncharacterized protein LOC120067568 [Benincasa hispida]|uniref:uncharacterized protein LOC120067568 n=1 Tax=Benincasa hispida TaxID=102211 RepID=UPI001902A78A|nr:uncharacterized protein LOC120067568 [Benincasa hispida]